MHQANGDTRLRAACIDHVDLVARRTRCSATRRGGERSKALEGPRYLLHLLLLLLLFLPSYVLLRVLAFLFLAQMYRTEPNRDRRDAREREQNRTERNVGVLSIPAYTRGRACPRLRGCTCTRVCFFNEIYYRTPNASGARGEGAAVRVLPTRPLSLSFSLSRSSPSVLTGVANVVALDVNRAAEPACR